MTNLERLKLEIEGISYTDDQLSIFLQENGLDPTAEYNSTSATNKKNILKTALSILEAIANNPTLMRQYKTDDMTILEFSDNLYKRIQMLQQKIASLATDEGIYEEGAKFDYLFRW